MQYISTHTPRDLEQEIRSTLLPDLRPLEAKLVKELAMYQLIVIGSQESQLLSFWQLHKRELPAWYSCFQRIALLQPSSASAERVFSQLRNAFGDQQESTLEDYKEASIMMRFNKLYR